MNSTLQALCDRALEDTKGTRTMTMLLEEWLSDLPELKPSQLRFITGLLDFHPDREKPNLVLAYARKELEEYLKILKKRDEKKKEKTLPPITTLTERLIKFWGAPPVKGTVTLDTIAAAAGRWVQGNTLIKIGTKTEDEMRHYLKLAFLRKMMAMLELLALTPITKKYREEIEEKSGGSIWQVINS